MPRLAKSELQKKNELILYIYQRAKIGYSLPAFCKLMGYSQKTHSNRMHHPEQFTLEQIRILCKLGRATEEEKSMIL